MFIKFKKVTAQNFLSIGNTPLEWTIDGMNKTLIKGINGSGKSSIMSSLTFGLFGKAYSKANKSSMVNSINGKGCVVQVYFSIGDIEYRVVRGMKPNIFEIYQNDVLIDQSTQTKDYQLILEDIIKMDFKTFTQCVMLGSMSYVPFLQLPAAERRAFIENLLDIESFTRMNKRLKNLIQENKNKIYAVNTDLNSSKNKIQLLESVITNLESDNSGKLKIITEELKVVYENYKKEEEAIKVLEESISKLIVDESKIQEIRNKISKCDSAISTKESEASRLRNQIKFFDTNPSCPQCGQSVDESHREKHLKEYNDELTKIGEFLIKTKQVKSQFEVELQHLNELYKNKTGQESQLKTLQQKLSWLKSDMTKKYAQKKELESSNSSSLVSEKKTEVEAEKQVLESIQENYNKLLHQQNVYDKIALSLKDSGAKADIIRNYVPTITALVNKYLEKLNLYVKFYLDEEFNETLKSRHRDEYQYESFSMGERFRINTAMLFTWLEIIKLRKGISTNLLAIDEILEVVDNDGFQDLLNIAVETQNMNCFVISHKENLEMLFDNIITVNKVKGFTQISVNND